MLETITTSTDSPLWSEPFGTGAGLNPHVEIAYDELRQLASSYMRRERPDHTFSATDLVHEAYGRLADDGGPTSWQNRRHFFGIVATAMRRVLIEHARSRSRDKRGGDWQRVTLGAGLWATPGEALAPEELLGLDRALDKLAAFDAR